MPRAGGPPGGRGVEDAATSGDRGGVGQEEWESTENKYRCGRTEGRNEGKKSNGEKKKNGKKTTTQDTQSHTENACKEHKNLGDGRRASDCEPEG